MPKTFNELKNELARVASGSGIVANDSRLKSLANTVQTRLGNKGDWEGIMEQVEFTIVDRVLTLPLRYETVAGLAVNDVNVSTMPTWYEFIAQGPGPQDDNNWVKKAIRRGRGPVIRQSYDEARYFRVYSFVDERVDSVAPTVRVLGYDENDVWIRSINATTLTWQDGVDIALNGHLVQNYVASPIKFKRITRVVKPTTIARVEIWWVDNVDDTILYFAGRYDYFETNPQYSKFVVPSLGTTAATHSVKALCRRKIYPIVTGDEELLFDNIEAFRLGMIATTREETAGGLQEASFLWEQAKQCLKDEYTSIHGASNAYPRVNVVGDPSLTGSGLIPDIF